MSSTRWSGGNGGEWNNRDGSRASSAKLSIGSCSRTPQRRSGDCDSAELDLDATKREQLEAMRAAMRARQQRETSKRRSAQVDAARNGHHHHNDHHHHNHDDHHHADVECDDWVAHSHGATLPWWYEELGDEFGINIHDPRVVAELLLLEEEIERERNERALRMYEDCYVSDSSPRSSGVRLAPNRPPALASGVGGGSEGGDGAFGLSAHQLQHSLHSPFSGPRQPCPSPAYTMSGSFAGGGSSTGLGFGGMPPPQPLPPPHFVLNESFSAPPSNPFGARSAMQYGAFSDAGTSGDLASAPRSPTFITARANEWAPSWAFPSGYESADHRHSGGGCAAADVEGGDAEHGGSEPDWEQYYRSLTQEQLTEY